MKEAAEKGEPEGRGEKLLFAFSDVRIASAFLPRSINCCGGGGRAEDSGEQTSGDSPFLCLSARSRRGIKFVGGRGSSLLYGPASLVGGVLRVGRWT